MRLQDNVFAPHAAPTAGVSVASFHEVDGALVLGTPRAFDDLVARLIDLDEAAGRQNGKHGEILHADVAIGEVAVGKLRQVGEGNQAPLFDHASEIGGTAGGMNRASEGWGHDTKVGTLCIESGKSFVHGCLLRFPNTLIAAYYLGI